MEEKIIVVMEVSTPLIEGAKPNQALEMSVWCRHLHRKIRQEFFLSLGGGIAHKKRGWKQECLDSKYSTLLHV